LAIAASRNTRFAASSTPYRKVKTVGQAKVRKTRQSTP